MYTLVCDPTICYGPATSAQTFTLMPLDSGEMDVHFVNEIGLITTAHVRLRLVNQANPADTLWVDYRFDSQTFRDANDRLEKTTVKLYPNPVTDYFMLENATAMRAASSVYTLDGRPVHYFSSHARAALYLDGIARWCLYPCVGKQRRARVAVHPAPKRINRAAFLQHKSHKGHKRRITLRAFVPL